ncbi:NAD-binding protein [Streptomyces sp. NPDC002012]|uniref:NAD-binding protein n=1 Tax=Streptomyces sp. NPDC002012 TaxID=3154532 RepID=UPI003318691C
MVICGDDGLARRLAVELDAVCGETVTVILPSRHDEHGGEIDTLHRAPRPPVELLIAARPDEQTLRAAGVERAAALALAYGDDQTNMMAALLARSLNPSVRLVIRMYNRERGRHLEQLLDRTVLARRDRSDAAAGSPRIAVRPRAAMSAHRPVTQAWVRCSRRRSGTVAHAMSSYTLPRKYVQATVRIRPLWKAAQPHPEQRAPPGLPNSRGSRPLSAPARRVPARPRVRAGVPSHHAVTAAPVRMRAHGGCTPSALPARSCRRRRPGPAGSETAPPRNCRRTGPGSPGRAHADRHAGVHGSHSSRQRPVSGERCPPTNGRFRCRGRVRPGWRLPPIRRGTTG